MDPELLKALCKYYQSFLGSDDNVSPLSKNQTQLRWNGWAYMVAQMVKNSPAMWDTWVRSLDWEDPWRRKWLPTPAFCPGEFLGLSSPWDHKESDMAERLPLHFTYIGERKTT